MTAQYPNEVFTPREKENRVGVVYDEDKKKTLFVEDLQVIEDEVKEIEERLMPNTDKPLPYGVRIGDENSYLSIISSETGPYTIPTLTSNVEIPDFGKVLAVENFLITASKPGNPALLLFLDSALNEVGILFYDANRGGMYFNRPIGSITENENAGFAFLVNNENGQAIAYANMILNHFTNKCECSGNYLFYNDLECDKTIKSGNIVHALNGFRSGASLGVTSSYTIVGDVRMNAGVLQKRTRTIQTAGGLTTSVSALSDWTNA
jgi:hypothetical protein